MSVLTRIKNGVRNGAYVITQHALDEAVNDAFNVLDIKNVLLNGALSKKYTHDPRGTRYEIRGPTLDGRSMKVVCRFDSAGNVRVMTVFEAFNP